MHSSVSFYSINFYNFSWVSEDIHYLKCMEVFLSKASTYLGKEVPAVGGGRRGEPVKGGRKEGRKKGEDAVPRSNEFWRRWWVKRF